MLVFLVRLNFSVSDVFRGIPRNLRLIKVHDCAWPSRLVVGGFTGVEEGGGRP